MIFFLLFNFIAIQDIAIDGWAIEMLKKENKAYAATAQTIGKKLGYALGSIIFLALSTLKFCNDYFYAEPQLKPLMTLDDFFFCWSVLTLLIALFITFFVSEHEIAEVDGEKVDFDIKESLQILGDIMKKE